MPIVLMVYSTSPVVVSALGWLVILSGLLVGWVTRLLYRNRALRAAYRDEILARQAAQTEAARLNLALQAARANLRQPSGPTLRPILSWTKGGTA